MAERVQFTIDDPARLWKRGESAEYLGRESDHPKALNIHLFRMDDGQVIALSDPFERGLVTFPEPIAPKCIHRKYHGGAEDIDFATFATVVIQDHATAEDIAEQMLDGADPYTYNDDEPEFYETFEVLNADALRAQLVALNSDSE